MLGRRDRWQGDLFVAGSLGDLVPEDHPLKQIDRVLDLAWLRDEVKDLYCLDNGRPSLDPEVAMRLEIAGIVEGVAKSRALMRQGQVNLAIRWFVGYRLHEKLPDHSSLSVTRKRWGPERFRRLLERTVLLCQRAGLVGGKTLHVDATLIRADVSWDSLMGTWRCCRPGGSTREAGTRRSGRCTRVTDGPWRAFTGRPRLSTAWVALRGAACGTWRFRRT